MPHAQLLGWLTGAAVLACFISYCQRRTWRRPPRDAAEATLRQLWENARPYTQLGVRVRDDGYVYSNVRCVELGRVAGAEAKIVRPRPVTGLSSSTAWAVIYFADGTLHKNEVWIHRLAEAQAEVTRFNGQVKKSAPDLFRRTFTRPGTVPVP